jgi:dinuclear metal center YbgI/SA1388 family protein
VSLPSVRDLLEALEVWAPRRHAFSFDHVGLQVGSLDAAAGQILVSLDSSLGAVEAAREAGCRTLISHHPLIWDALPSLVTADSRQLAAIRLVEAGIAFIAVHTNWDTAPGGINDVLAQRLGLSDIRPFGGASESARLKAVVTVPEAAAVTVIDAMSRAGAGRIGAYERCSFSSTGEGAFIPGPDARPAIGSPGREERVKEVRIEMTVDARQKLRVAAAVREAHPYEEPVIDFYGLQDPERRPAGRIGERQAVSHEEALAWMDSSLAARSLLWQAHDRAIRRVAVVGGAADGEWKAALEDGADLFITGEVRQNVAIEAADAGLSIAACGHYATEQPGMERLAGLLMEAGWDARAWAPQPGRFGRPL